MRSVERPEGVWMKVGMSDCTLGWNIIGMPLERDQYMACHQRKAV